MSLPLLVKSLRTGEFVALAFDESKHPRGKKGTHEGGKFVASHIANKFSSSLRRATKPIHPRATKAAVHAREAVSALRRGDLKAAKLAHDKAARAHSDAADYHYERSFWSSPHAEHHDQMGKRHEIAVLKHNIAADKIDDELGWED